MTALEETRKKERRKNEKDDGLFSVTVCQVIFTVIAVLSLLVLSKGETDTARNIKDDFRVLMSNSLLKEDFSSALKSIKDYLDSPAEISVFKLFSKDETEKETTENTAETKKSDSKAEKETSKESDITETKPTEETKPKPSTAEKTTETVTAKKTSFSSSKNSGGNDLKTYTVNTSAAINSEKAIVAPVSGWYSSYYGYRTNPITGNNTFHTGLDIAASQGTKIKAAYSGVVRKVGEDSRSGKYLYLTHSDGTETLYCHCSKVLAEEGAVIRQGETIALVGSTGWSTGPHLHFEIHKNGERLDPLLFLKNDN